MSTLRLESMVEIMSSEYDETYDSVISNVKSDANQGDMPFNIPVYINQESELALQELGQSCSFMFIYLAVEFLLPIRSLLDQVLQWLCCTCVL